MSREFGNLIYRIEQLTDKYRGGQTSVLSETFEVLEQSSHAINQLNIKITKLQRQLINPQATTHENPKYDLLAWQYAVQRGMTEMGYQDWVTENLRLED